MKTLILNGDPHQMNWVEGSAEWGAVKAPGGLRVEKSSRREQDLLYERYTFTNQTPRDLFTSLTDVGIYTPFNDDYRDASQCMTNRCHAHVWCGGGVSYVMALRMGGEPPHLGLALVEGSLAGYSVERDQAGDGQGSPMECLSNDRGDIILHPAPASLGPGESFSVEWVLFPHQGKEDFYRQLPLLCPRYMGVSADRYVAFQGESFRLWARPCYPFRQEEVQVAEGGRAVPFGLDGGVVAVTETPARPGEYTYQFRIGKASTFCRVLALPGLDALAESRCRFIAEKQQYHKKGSALDGAYLIYDMEEGHMHYDPLNDHNGGRERIGMGVLMARFLQRRPDQALEDSLREYLRYVDRELVDGETGLVCNDCRRDDSFQRMYNYPWAAEFYLELYSLWGREEHLLTACRVMRKFYELGGGHFYAIDVPLARMARALESMPGWRAELMERFREHCDYILERDTDYPAHEVNYEQSIVAPAANLLLEMYQATGEEKYLQGGRRQLEVLELFNGLQPDHHLYQVAVRHWDGFWFGKRRMFGDTFPHYWSALTAQAYALYGTLAGEPAYLEKAEAAFRGVLSLFRPDGGASCACLYPASVSGERAGFYDPYANDQDWGLYYMLDYEDGKTQA